jgi:hypothetical protein
MGMSLNGMVEFLVWGDSEDARPRERKQNDARDLLCQVKKAGGGGRAHPLLRRAASCGRGEKRRLQRLAFM